MTTKAESPQKQEPRRSTAPLVDDSDDFDEPKPGYRVVWNHICTALIPAVAFLRSGGGWVVGGHTFLLSGVISLWQLFSKKLTGQSKATLLATSITAAILVAAAIAIPFRGQIASSWSRFTNRPPTDVTDVVENENNSSSNPKLDLVAASDTSPSTATSNNTANKITSNSLPASNSNDPWGTVSIPSPVPAAATPTASAWNTIGSGVSETPVAAVPNLFTTPSEPSPLVPSRSAFDLAAPDPTTTIPDVVNTSTPPLPQIQPAPTPPAPPAIAAIQSLPMVVIAEPPIAAVAPPPPPSIEEPAGLFPLPPPSEEPPMIAIVTPTAAPISNLVAPVEPFAPLDPPAAMMIPVSRASLDTSLLEAIQEPLAPLIAEVIHLPEESPIVPEDPPLPVPFAEETTDLTALLPSGTNEPLPSTVPPPVAAAPLPIVVAPLPKIRDEAPVTIDADEASEAALLTSFAPIQPPEPTSATPQPGTLYRAQPGDNWWNIAQRAYGAGGSGLFRSLAAYNRERVANLAQIEGEVIELPPQATLQAWTAAPVPGLNTKPATTLPAIGTAANVTNTTSRSQWSSSPTLLPGTIIYIVREGETLQSIAETKLGHRSRDIEIVRLNSDRLSSTTPLTAGMEILLPLPTGTQRSVTAAYTQR